MCAMPLSRVSSRLPLDIDPPQVAKVDDAAYPVAGPGQRLHESAGVVGLRRALSGRPAVDHARRANITVGGRQRYAMHLARS